MTGPRWKRPTIAIVKAAVAALVLLAVGRHVYRTWIDLTARGVDLHFDPTWLAISGLLYLAGLSACGFFYGSILRASPTPIGIIPALRAYLVSHLGKYVPGKAMVVVMRAGLSMPFGARGATAAIATFYETLVMMASGGLVAAAGFGAATGSGQVSLDVPGWGPVDLPMYRLASLAGLALGLAFLAVVAPPIFSRLARFISLPIPGVGPDAMPGLSSGLLSTGVLATSIGWVLLGASQLAVICAMERHGVPSTLMAAAPVVIASVALATVAGFVVAVMPGGLGVREGVLMSALAPALGADRAVVAALVLRLVWVAAEVLAAAVLVPILRPGRVGSDADPGTNPSMPAEVGPSRS